MRTKLVTALMISISFCPVSLSAAEETTELGEIVVEGKTESPPNFHYIIPKTIVTKEDFKSINASTTEDLIKYQPSLIVRRRYIGDPNGTIGMRGSNMFQTTRSMVYADGLPLHYLLQSRYSGAPRWSLVSPDEIQAIEILYGPFSAEYSGNSMAGVINIKTRMPNKREFNFGSGVFSQDYNYLGTKDTFSGHREFLSYGNKFNDLSVYLSHNHLVNNSQPQSIYYNGVSTPIVGETNVTGPFKNLNSTGAPSIYYGDSGSEKVTTGLSKLKLGYNLNGWSTIFTLAYEDRNRKTENPNNYLRDINGNPVWNGSAIYNGDAFSVSGSRFAISRQHRRSLLIGGKLTGPLGNTSWKQETSFSYFNILEDLTLKSNLNPLDPAFDGSGRVGEFEDTGWLTFDYRARTKRFLGQKDMKFVIGYHYDHYSLGINDYNSDNFASGIKTSQRQSTGGDTMTHALFVQWGWNFTKRWDVALGARYEHWKSSDGYYYNYTGSDIQDFPLRTETGFSPKFSIGFAPNQQLKLRYSAARAIRFPIVEELFKNEFTTSGTTIADADLKPEDGIHHNIMAQRKFRRGFMRINLFHEEISDVIFNQRITLPDSTTVSTFLPIDKVKSTGVGFIFKQNRIFNSKLDLSFNINYTDSKIAKHSANPGVEGNVFPRMPKWRSKLLLTYNFNKQWKTSIGARFASDSFGTLTNSDNVDNVYGAQDAYRFVDLKASYQASKSVNLSLGVDNVTNENAFVYHPWPQRTFYFKVKISL